MAEYSSFVQSKYQKLFGPGTRFYEKTDDEDEPEPSPTPLLDTPEGGEGQSRRFRDSSGGHFFGHNAFSKKHTLVLVVPESKAPALGQTQGPEDPQPIAPPVPVASYVRMGMLKVRKLLQPHPEFKELELKVARRPKGMELLAFVACNDPAQIQRLAKVVKGADWECDHMGFCPDLRILERFSPAELADWRLLLDKFKRDSLLPQTSGAQRRDLVAQYATKKGEDGLLQQLQLFFLDAEFASQEKKGKAFHPLEVAFSHVMFHKEHAPVIRELFGLTHPGTITPGKPRATAYHCSTTLHGIPFLNCKLLSKEYLKIWRQILGFVPPGSIIVIRGLTQGCSGDVGVLRDLQQSAREMLEAEDPTSAELKLAGFTTPPTYLWNWVDIEDVHQVLASHLPEDQVQNFPIEELLDPSTGPEPEGEDSDLDLPAGWGYLNLQEQRHIIAREWTRTMHEGYKEGQPSYHGCDYHKYAVRSIVPKLARKKGKEPSALHCALRDVRVEVLGLGNTLCEYMGFLASGAQISADLAKRNSPDQVEAFMYHHLVRTGPRLVRPGMQQATAQKE